MKKIFTILLAAAISQTIMAQCTDLFFSEYVEGLSNNKGLELYNPTNAAISLSGYKILLYTNGAVTPSKTLNLSGNIASLHTYVMSDSSANGYIKALADTILNTLAGNDVTSFNGNDAIALVKNNTDTLDIIGQIGVNPGNNSGWTVDTGTTANHTLIRHADVHAGTKDWTISATQWSVLPHDTVRLGSHTMNACGTVVVPSVVFSPNAYTFSGVNGNYNEGIVLNAQQSTAYTVQVQLISGNAAYVNNYTTQTVSFPINTQTQTLPLTITNDTTGGATHVLVFKLVSPSGNLTIGNDSLFTLTLTPPPATPTVPVYNIAQIRPIDANLSPDSLGVHCGLKGTVYGINYRGTGMQFFIHDATGGIQVFSPSNDFGYSVTEGDSVYVQGVVAFFKGMTQLATLDTVYKIGTHALNSPVLVADLDENSESELVRLNNLTLVTPSQWDTTAHSSGFSVDVTDGVNTWVVRIDEQTDIYKTNEAAPTFTFDVIGMGAQFDTAAPYNCCYQLYPRYHQDIIIHTGINETTHNISRIYPNPAHNQFVVELVNVADAEIKLFNLQGEVVYYSQQNNTNHFAINTENYSSGLYSIEVKSKNGVSRSKITVQH
jgi:predicted extracellular nuclease